MNLLYIFIIYGLFGWAVEILFTAITESYKKKNWKLEGVTYLWMFPIYGFGGLLFDFAYTQSVSFGITIIPRLLIFLAGLYIIELIFGFILLKVTGDYVWKYNGRWQFAHIINFAYAPAWIVFLLALEQLHQFIDRLSLI